MNYWTIKERCQEISSKIQFTEEIKLRKEQELEEVKKEEENLIQARWIITEVAQKTQERFKERVESLVTLAIQSVFERPFKFYLEFERKANKFSCQPIIKEGDNEYIPKDDMGGGIIDLISFAFRVVLWSLEYPKSRNVFILDEPMKFIGKGDLLEKAGKMLREVSYRLKFQLIIITHEPELAEISDRAYQVIHNGNQSIIQLIKD